MAHEFQSDESDLAGILDRASRVPIDGPYKSLPGSFRGSPSEIADLRWSVTRDVPLPSLVVDWEALRSNIMLFQQYLQEHGVAFAPHAKATMSPQIWHEQLAAGAWGLTVATQSQLEVCVAFGVRRVLIANEIVDTYSAKRLVELINQHEWLSVTCLVDSDAAARRLHDSVVRSGPLRRLDVLVELGMPGGRTGARSLDDLLRLCEYVRALPALRLVGVEGYEGILGVDRGERALAAVDHYLARLVEATRAVIPLVEAGTQPLASAGGSMYFDRVVEAFTPISSECTLVLRSGCYATHDSVMFEHGSPWGATASGCHHRLTPALRVYAAVLSRPEPGVAIAGAGARDVPLSEGLPVVHAIHTVAGTTRPGDQLRVGKANDHHLYLSVPTDDQLAVGDVLELGLSHPCAAFDRWRLYLVADRERRVTGVGRTYF